MANYKAEDVHQFITNLDEGNTYIFKTDTMAFVGMKHLKKSKDNRNHKKNLSF